MDAPAEFCATRGAENIHLSWLVRLRWLALAGQVLVLFGVERVLGIALPRGPVAVVLGAIALSNALCARVVGRRRVTEGSLVVVLAFDISLLTALLHMAGGPVNPFSFLYLVHIALAAVTLRPAAAWALAGWSLLSFGVLFVLPPWPHSLVHEEVARGDPLWLHVRGMYVAFGLSAVLVVYFIQHIRQALAERERELAAARDLSARHSKFVALATLATGAAHELGTPLSTIAVIAKDLQNALRDADEDVVADVQLIREQVRRCQEIVQQMSAKVGPGAGEGLEFVPIDQLALTAATSGAGRGVGVEVEVGPELYGKSMPIARGAFARAVGNLVRNAVQASPPGGEVRVCFAARDRGLLVEVRDRGKGMSRAVLARAGEPFFTTKPPGEGTGLGLFLTRTMVEQMGGRLEIESTEGCGTTARVWVPWLDAPQSCGT